MEGGLIPQPKFNELRAKDFSGPIEYYTAFNRAISSLLNNNQKIVSGEHHDDIDKHIRLSISRGTNPLKSLRQKMPGEWIFNPRPEAIEKASVVYIENQQDFIWRCSDISEGHDTSLKLPTDRPWTIAYIPEITLTDTKASEKAKRVN